MTEPTAELVTDEEHLARVVARAGGAERVAVDVEGDGLYAYRAKLCTVQLAWREGDETAIAVVDTLATSALGLQPLLGAEGPTKVLHDCAFDARLLADSGVTLACVRDTSVAARMLGRKSTGLLSLAASELGVTLEKSLQQHDWARRPLREAELTYLAGDVRYLLQLDDALEVHVAALDIGAEVTDETAYKLASSLAPVRDDREPYERVKGGDRLTPPERAVLRQVALAREAAARSWDVPPFKVASNELLLDLSRKQPMSRAALVGVAGSSAGRAGRLAREWLEAVEQGVTEPPIELPRVVRTADDRARQVARRLREARLSAWRRTEAAARGVDEQVVLPGHCLQDLASGEFGPGGAPFDAVAGLGALRLSRYAQTFADLVVDPPVGAGAVEAAGL